MAPLREGPGRRRARALEWYLLCISGDARTADPRRTSELVPVRRDRRARRSSSRRRSRRFDHTLRASARQATWRGNMATVVRLLEDPTVEPDYRPEASGREPSGSLPVYSAVLASSGRRYLSDEYHHRVIVEEPTGERWTFGGYGTGPGEFNRPRGLVLQEGQDPSASRLFVCDSWNHRLQVFDGDGQWLRMFGTVGSGEGQFDVPSDVTIVPLLGSLGDEGTASSQRTLLAVANRWNSRIQVPDTSGRFVAVVGGRDRYTAVVLPDRQGAPRAGGPSSGSGWSRLSGIRPAWCGRPRTCTCCAPTAGSSESISPWRSCRTSMPGVGAHPSPNCTPPSSTSAGCSRRRAFCRPPS